MKKTDIIDFNELPYEILKQIPYSIRTKSKKYILNELPLPIQYLIEKYYDLKFPTITYETALDFKPDISRYSDFGIYESTSDLLKEYLKNYLLIRLKSYPFDPMFGCALKDQLMMLDSSLRQTYVSNELKLVSSVLSNDLNLDVKVTKFNIDRQVGTANTQYVCNIELKVNNELIRLAVSSSD